MILLDNDIQTSLKEINSLKDEYNKLQFKVKDNTEFIDSFINELTYNSNKIEGFTINFFMSM